MYVARQPVELGHDHRAFGFARGFQRRSKLRPTVEGVRTLARLDLDELGGDLDPLGLRKAGAGGALCLDAKARTALLRR